ncbi:MAG: hypothetical protein IPM22_20755 [Betaproteobacteria bacterium]|nr:hypothetical protein [Betaproteobacteria bacterium]
MRSSRPASRSGAEITEQAAIDAKAEGDCIVAAACAEIEEEVARAKEQPSDSAADFAVAGATKILKKRCRASAV